MSRQPALALEAAAPATRRPPRIANPPALLAAAAAAGAVVVATLLAHGGDEEGLRLVARYTARLAFVVFCVVFAASPLDALWPGRATRALLRNRRAVGVAYGLAQMVHLGGVVAFFAGTAHTLDASVSTFGGGLGFAFAGAIAATSSDAAVRRLGRGWKRLHAVGLFYLWGIYAFTYVGRVSADPSYAPGLAAVLGLMALRVAARRQRRAG